MEFIGRQNEVKAINSLLLSSEYRGAVIYGRRRLGKTELLKHCLLNKGVPSIIYQCTQSSEETNTFDFALLVGQALNLSHLAFNSFIEAVAFVFAESKKRDIYLAIDEYPYIRKLIPGLDSKLQKLIDENHDSCHLKFFLSGSSIQTMEAILGEGNALYRRFNLSLLVKEMDYYDSSLFYPSFSSEDKVRLYSALGGVPFYNRQVNPSLSVKDNIIALLSGVYAHLLDETTISLKSELAKVDNANEVFSAIATGAFHYSDILSKSHISSSPILSDVLNKLVKMDLVTNVSPINEKNNKMKSGYRICDNAMRFYYRYLFNNASAHAIMNDEQFYDTFIKDDFEHEFVPKAFEVVAKQYLVRQNKLGKIKPLLTDIGTYWYDNPSQKKNGQFDIVGQCENGYIFYEVKFTNEKIDDAVIKEEVRQVGETTLKPVQFGFISRNGFATKEKYPYLLINLNEMF
jgi:AAA+ ATPase superfamily predicted ATPase